MFRSDDHELLSDLLFALGEWEETIAYTPEYAAEADEILLERTRDVRESLTNV